MIFCHDSSPSLNKFGQQNILKDQAMINGDLNFFNYFASSGLSFSEDN